MRDVAPKSSSMAKLPAYVRTAANVVRAAISKHKEGDTCEMFRLRCDAVRLRQKKSEPLMPRVENGTEPYRRPSKTNGRVVELVWK
jgi:hypothetical protein